jgi:hypothetical protein
MQPLSLIRSLVFCPEHSPAAVEEFEAVQLPELIPAELSPWSGLVCRLPDTIFLLSASS